MAAIVQAVNTDRRGTRGDGSEISTDSGDRKGIGSGITEEEEEERRMVMKKRDRLGVEVVRLRAGLIWKGKETPARTERRAVDEADQQALTQPGQLQIRFRPSPI